MRSSTKAHEAQFDLLEERWDDASIPNEWLLVGNPEPKMCLVSISRRTGATSGRWRCQPSVFNFSYVEDEWIYVVAGAAKVTVGSRSRELKVGDTAFFPKGATALWEVSLPIEKSFVLAGPPLVVRLISKVRQMAEKIVGTVRSR